MTNAMRKKGEGGREWQETGAGKLNRQAPKRQKEKEHKAGRNSRRLAGLKQPDVGKEELNPRAFSVRVPKGSYKGW